MNENGATPLFNTTSRSFLGLNENLWRIAVVTGIGQYSISLWSWEFGIFLYSIGDPWMIGVTFSVGTFAMLVGYILSGFIADLIGRRKTMAVAFLPVIAGLLSLANLAVWPIVVFEYALIQFGWSFILIMSRAIPADEIQKAGGKDSARKFTMVLLPAFLLDGISPIVGAYLLDIGYAPSNLHTLAGVGAVVAFTAAIIFVRETLGTEVIKKARSGPLISFRNLGRNFWFLVGGMAGFYLFFNSALSYWSLIVTEDWGISETIFGYSWSAFSLTSVLFMYTVSGLADRNIKRALIVAVFANSVLIFAYAFLSGIPTLLLLNIIWALPVVLWIGAERSLIVSEISEEAKGRALGTYQFLMSSTNLVSANLGAFIWEASGSLRFLWLVCGFGTLGTSFVAAACLKKIDMKREINNSD
ncbi:MAG: MFS transporter [Promethearchaeota archaeon]